MGVGAFHSSKICSIRARRWCLVWWYDFDFEPAFRWWPAGASTARGRAVHRVVVFGAGPVGTEPGVVDDPWRAAAGADGAAAPAGEVSGARAAGAVRGGPQPDRRG